MARKEREDQGLIDSLYSIANRSRKAQVQIRHLLCSPQSSGDTLKTYVQQRECMCWYMSAKVCNRGPKSRLNGAARSAFCTD
jgi:hypothetical protein